MHEYFLEAKKISKSFQGVQALKEVDFKIRQGEAHCIVGENGSGKSTLIKIISGVYAPDEGEILIEGKTYKHIRTRDAIALGINVIYQDFSLIPNLSAAENIAIANNLAMHKKTVNQRENREFAEGILEKMGVVIDTRKNVRDLPVAERQIVAICRALSQGVKLVIMDEPTTALTSREVENLFSIIVGLKKQNISLIFVSHKLDEVFKVSERVCILRNGQNVVDGPTSEFNHSKMTYYMTGREIAEEPFRPIITQKKPILRVEGLSKIGSFSDINFELYGGEVLGIIGLLGSGRSGLADALFGLQSIQGGKIYLDGKKLKIKTPSEAVKHGIAYVPEDRLTQGLFLDVEIDRNIGAAILTRNTCAGILMKRSVRNTVMRMINSLAIKISSTKNPVKSLSGGNQQRVVLAKWLATDPKLLILNCPTVGVDVGSKTDIHTIIKNLAGRGIGIILISDDLPEILHVCNRVLVMNKGRITSRFLTAETTQEVLQNEFAKV